jgi:hypothetical protein
VGTLAGARPPASGGGLPGLVEARGQGPDDRRHALVDREASGIDRQGSGLRCLAGGSDAGEFGNRALAGSLVEPFRIVCEGRLSAFIWNGVLLAEEHHALINFLAIGTKVF